MTRAQRGLTKPNHQLNHPWPFLVNGQRSACKPRPKPRHGFAYKSFARRSHRAARRRPAARRERPAAVATAMGCHHHHHQLRRLAVLAAALCVVVVATAARPLQARDTARRWRWTCRRRRPPAMGRFEREVAAAAAGGWGLMHFRWSAACRCRGWPGRRRRWPGRGAAGAAVRRRDAAGAAKPVGVAVQPVPGQAQAARRRRRDDVAGGARGHPGHCRRVAREDDGGRAGRRRAQVGRLLRQQQLAYDEYYDPLAFKYRNELIDLLFGLKFSEYNSSNTYVSLHV